MASGTGTAADPRLYTIATETASAAVNSRMLRNEITADGTVGGLTLLSIDKDIDADELRLSFSVALTGGEITALDAVVLAHAAVTTVRTWQKWESAAQQNTTLETWVSAIQQTAAALSEGTYRIAWYMEVRLTPVAQLNSRAAARFSFGGSVKSTGFSDVDEWVPISGWDFIQAAEGDTPVVEIEFRRDPAVGGNDTIDARKFKMSTELMEEE